MGEQNMLTAELMLKIIIDDFYKDVPKGMRTDFQMLPDDPKRLIAAEAMKKYAAQQTAALREELKDAKRERDQFGHDNKFFRVRHSEMAASISDRERELEAVKNQLSEVTRQRDEAVKNTVELCRKAFAAGMDLDESGGRGEDWKGFYNRELSRLSSGETKPVSPVGSNTLNVLAVLSTLSPARSKAAFGLGVDEWSLPEWACALAGEVGELCNFIKKTNRDGLDRTEDIAKEAADVAIYLDLLCTRAGIDLQAAIVSKFNEVSDRMNCDIKFPAPPES